MSDKHLCLVVGDTHCRISTLMTEVNPVDPGTRFYSKPRLLLDTGSAGTGSALSDDKLSTRNRHRGTPDAGLRE